MGNFRSPSWLELATDDDDLHLPLEGDKDKPPQVGEATPPAAKTATSEPPQVQVQAEDIETVRKERETIRKESETLRAQVEELRGTVQRFSSMGEDLKRFREENKQLLTLREQEGKDKPPQVDEEAEFRDNPLNYLRDQVKALRDNLAGMTATRTQELQRQEQSSNEQKQLQDFETAVRREVAEYRKANPQYDEALSFITERRMNELRDLGAHDDQIEQTIYQDGLRLAATAKHAGKNIGDYVTSVAKIWGWQPPTAGGKDTKGAQQQAPQGASLPAGVLDIQESIRRLQEKRAASSTVAGQGSSTKKSALEAIADMSDNEFDEFWQEFEKQSKLADRMFQIRQ